MDSVNRWCSAPFRPNGPVCSSTQYRLHPVCSDITVLLEPALLLSGKRNLVWPLRCMSNEHEFVINVSFQRLTVQPGFAILMPRTHCYQELASAFTGFSIHNFTHLLTLCYYTVTPGRVLAFAVCKRILRSL